MSIGQALSAKRFSFGAAHVDRDPGSRHAHLVGQECHVLFCHGLYTEASACAPGRQLLFILGNELLELTFFKAFF